MKTRKIPMRRCIGCMESKEKKALVRIVADADGGVLLDRTGKAQGRGAYICPDPGCFRLARKKKAIARNLGITVSESNLDRLSEEFETYGEK